MYVATGPFTDWLDDIHNISLTEIIYRILRNRKYRCSDSRNSTISRNAKFHLPQTIQLASTQLDHLKYKCMAAKQVVLFKLLAHHHHHHHHHQHHHSHHQHHHDKIKFSHLTCSAYKHKLLITASILATRVHDFFLFLKLLTPNILIVLFPFSKPIHAHTPYTILYTNKHVVCACCWLSKQEF